MVTVGFFLFQGKTHMVEPGIEPGISWLVVSNSDHQATRLVAWHKHKNKELHSWDCLTRKMKAVGYLETLAILAESHSATSKKTRVFSNTAVKKIILRHVWQNVPTFQMYLLPPPPPPFIRVDHWITYKIPFQNNFCGNLKLIYIIVQQVGRNNLRLL